MNDIQIFNNAEFGEIRTIEENGKVLFCGSDVAKALGYNNPNKAINDHCRAITKRSTPISGKIQEINFISEGDIYRLAAKSKLPGADKFESWIFDDVLPTIHRTGTYGVTQLTGDALIAKALIEAKNLLDNIKAENFRLCEKIEENKPKVLFANAVETAHTSILVGDLAKLIKQNGVDIGQKRLFDYLRNNGYLIKGGSSKNMPTQKSMEQKLFEVKERTINNPDGTVRITKTTKVTGKGQTYFINKFLSDKDK